MLYYHKIKVNFTNTTKIIKLGIIKMTQLTTLLFPKPKLKALILVSRILTLEVGNQITLHVVFRCLHVSWHVCVHSEPFNFSSYVLWISVFDSVWKHLKKIEVNITFPWIRVTNGLTVALLLWECNWGLLEKQPEHLSTEETLQPIMNILIWIITYREISEHY